MKKRLYRSTTDKKLEGVCGGIAEYLDMDSTIIRLIVVAGIFFSWGAVLLLYIIAAFIIPKRPAVDENENMSEIKNHAVDAEIVKENQTKEASQKKDGIDLSKRDKQ